MFPEDVFGQERDPAPYLIAIHPGGIDPMLVQQPPVVRHMGIGMGDQPFAAGARPCVQTLGGPKRRLAHASMVGEDLEGREVIA
jgi:hypothetical protein